MHLHDLQAAEARVLAVLPTVSMMLSSWPGTPLLLAVVSAPRQARDWIQRVCTDWALGPQSVDAATLIGSELVANMVTHARTPAGCGCTPAGCPSPGPTTARRRRCRTCCPRPAPRRPAWP